MSQAAGLGPVCYRHPDRETYIRCNRCEQPICPDCMVTASVGFQCPQCVHEGAKSIRPTRTIAGGRTIARPTVTYALIAICVAVFGLESVTGTNAAIDRFGMAGYYIAHDGQAYRLLTSAFLHAGFLHIAFNMYVLYALAPMVEAFLGHVRFAVLYLVAALGGSVASYFFSSPLVPSVGASGAIFGVMAALVVVAHRIKADVRQPLTLIAVNLALGFAISGVDWRAHLGGLVVGAALAAVFAYAPPHPGVQAVAVVAVLAVLVVLYVTRTNHLQQQFANFAHSFVHTWGRTTTV